MRILLAITLGFCIAAYAVADSEAGRYLTTAEFLQTAFPEGAPDSSTLWVQGDLRGEIETVLGHPFGSLRVRYWYDGVTSAWVLDEVGKDLPITIGVTIAAGEIRGLRILQFRESRGWEVRYPFFTDQFRDARLGEDGNLDRHVDGISGATLSVKAVTRIARTALLLHASIDDQN